MKRLIFSLAAFCLISPFASAQDASPTSSLSREDYADRSAQELRQLRAQVDAVAQQAPQPAQARFAPIYDALSQAEDALAEWKVAGPIEAPQRRADYEKAHARAVQAWNDFKVSQSRS